MVTSTVNGASVSSRNLNGNGKTATKRPIVSETNGDSTPKRPKLQERTDYSRWRMLDEAGRHTWHYLEDEEDAKEWPQSLADKWYLGLPMVIPLSALHIPLLTPERTSLPSHLPKHPSIPSRMASNSFNISNCPRGTGAANMADQCSCYQGSS